MVITKKSQLGLMFSDNEVKLDFLNLMKGYCDSRLSSFNKALELATQIDTITKNGGDVHKDLVDFQNEADIIGIGDTDQKLIDKITDSTGFQNLAFVTDEGTKYFYICDSVYKAAELVRISENFTSRTLKDINFGSYTYLMGKNRMVRFICGHKAIKGFYYSDTERNAFEFGLDLDNGQYYAPKDCAKEFSMIMQVLAFVELGDIEVVEIEAGRSNGKPKKEGKVANTTKNDIFVVDTSWNKITVRTDGFMVRGHLRLQPCGTNMEDRKLIWVSAFQKNGYTRPPRARMGNEQNV